MTGGLLRRGHTEERRPCHDGSRDWSDAATTQETLRRASSHQQPETARKDSSPVLSGRARPERHLGQLAGCSTAEI